MVVIWLPSGGLFCGRVAGVMFWSAKSSSSCIIDVTIPGSLEYSNLVEIRIPKKFLFVSSS